MPKITADIPSSLNSALNDEIARTNTDASSIVTAALAQYLKTPVHTLFQVSTSGALVTKTAVFATLLQEQYLTLGASMPARSLTRFWDRD